MPIHPERFEAVAFLADAQFQRLGNPVCIHPGLKRVMVGTCLLQRQGCNIPALAV
jgi:hypothetical protein